MSRQGLGQLLDVRERLAKDNLPARSAHKVGLHTGWARPLGRPGHRGSRRHTCRLLDHQLPHRCRPRPKICSRAIERCQKGAATPAQLRGPCRRQWASLGGGCSRGRSPSSALASWAGPAPSASALGRASNPMVGGPIYNVRSVGVWECSGFRTSPAALLRCRRGTQSES